MKKAFVYQNIINYFHAWLHTFSCPWAGLGRRSASMSYFRILKHSSRSSRNSAYVRTQAEQSQAEKQNKTTQHFLENGFPPSS